MANHTPEITKAATEAGVTADQLREIIQRCGSKILGGSIAITNRREADAALRAIRATVTPTATHGTPAAADVSRARATGRQYGVRGEIWD